MTIYHRSRICSRAQALGIVLLPGTLWLLGCNNDPGNILGPPGSPGSQLVALTTGVIGEGGVSPGSGQFNPSETVTLTATPAEGWRFDHWEGALSGGRYDHWRDAQAPRANPGELTMDRNKIVTAVFAPRASVSQTFDLGGGVTLTVIEVPGGEFIMGSSDDERARFIAPGLSFDDEAPQHTVTVSSFAMGETEVTQAQFEALMGFVPNIPEDCQGDCFEIALGDTLAVAWVFWFDAMEFCDRLSEIGDRACRLPTEAEWEYACRAGAPTAFSFGDSEEDLDAYAWWRGNSGALELNPREVATKLPNAWGLYDMHGNAWEWVGDWWGAYPQESQTDPTGVAFGDTAIGRKVLRGGSYNRFPWALRCAYRLDPHGPQKTQFNLGFRVVCE